MIIEWSSRALDKFPGSQLLFQAGRGCLTHLALAADAVPAGGREKDYSVKGSRHSKHGIKCDQKTGCATWDGLVFLPFNLDVLIGGEHNEILVSLVLSQ